MTTLKVFAFGLLSGLLLATLLLIILGQYINIDVLLSKAYKEEK